MADPVTRPRLLPALALAAVLSSTCASSEKFAPRHPGDTCLDVCPEGLHCASPPGTSKAGGTDPKQCTLDAGRCITDADCNNHVARCVGATAADVGYCNYPLPMGL
jgi:hypothetical protein